MLVIHLPEVELFNNETNEFITKDALVVRLEHSLVSLSKWEEIFERPFLSDSEKTSEETYEYIRCMNLDPEVDPDFMHRIDREDAERIKQHIVAKRTATWFSEPPPGSRPPRKEVITAEIIYYWMVALEIPFECENWHLNKLLTLIKVTNEKTKEAQNSGKKKPLTRSALDQRRALNEARRNQLGTSG